MPVKDVIATADFPSSLISIYCVPNLWLSLELSQQATEISANVGGTGFLRSGDAEVRDCIGVKMSSNEGTGRALTANEKAWTAALITRYVLA